MLTSNTSPATITETTVAPVTSEAPAITTEAVKPAKPSKPRAAKPSVPPAVEPAALDTRAERQAAALAVREFYNGASLPFKSAHASLSDLNTNNAKKPSVRTAALVAAMLAYAPAGAINKRGEFKRGAFLVPAKLINPNAKPGEMLSAMPESGCLGNMLGRVVHHVSGPIGGKQARDGIFRIDFAAARRELQQLGDKTAKPAIAVLDKLAPVKPAKAA